MAKLGLLAPASGRASHLLGYLLVHVFVLVYSFTE